MIDKILIADDDPDVRFILESVLKRAGYEVISAMNGKECLEKVVSEKPSLVILDIVMPDMDGWDVCRKIKKDFPNLPVTMCSILRDSFEIDRSFNYAGADGHITKPLDFDEVLNTARTLQSERSTIEKIAGVAG